MKRIIFIFILIIMISINRFSDPVSIAEDYLNLQWIVDSVNVYSNYTTTGNPHAGYYEDIKIFLPFSLNGKLEKGFDRIMQIYKLKNVSI